MTVRSRSTVTDPTPPGSPAGLLCFVVLAYGLAWLVALPAWLTGGLTSPWFGVGATAMMLTPALASLIALRLVERRPFRTGVSAGIAALWGIRPSTPLRHWFAWLGIGWLLIMVLIVAAYLLSAIAGVWHPDPVGLSGFAAVLRAQGAQVDGIPLPLLAAAQLVSAATVGTLITAVFTTGEELGWRGYLYPALLARLPRGVAVLVGGVVWGLWHAPLILLGYNYGAVPGWLGLAMMCGFATWYGTILAWLRVRSGSIWPAVLGHAVLNTVASAILLVLGDAARPPNPLVGTPLGVIGWIPAAGLALILIVRRSAWRTRRPGTTDRGTAHDLG